MTNFDFYNVSMGFQVKHRAITDFITNNGNKIQPLENCPDNHKSGLSTVAYSSGSSGINGLIVFDSINGTFYATDKRSSDIFRLL